jgi:hypothetical protein
MVALGPGRILRENLRAIIAENGKADRADESDANQQVEYRSPSAHVRQSIKI